MHSDHLGSTFFLPWIDSFPFTAVRQVDIFSYGMLLFELLTGQRPFENLTSGQEVNRAVLARERPQVSEGIYLLDGLLIGNTILCT